MFYKWNRKGYYIFRVREQLFIGLIFPNNIFPAHLKAFEGRMEPLVSKLRRVALPQTPKEVLKEVCKEEKKPEEGKKDFSWYMNKTSDFIDWSASSIKFGAETGGEALGKGIGGGIHYLGTTYLHKNTQEANVSSTFKHAVKGAKWASQKTVSGAEVKIHCSFFFGIIPNIFFYKYIDDSIEYAGEVVVGNSIDKMASFLNLTFFPNFKHQKKKEQEWRICLHGEPDKRR